jgi:hypothetical protein
VLTTCVMLVEAAAAGGSHHQKQQQQQHQAVPREGSGSGEEEIPGCSSCIRSFVQQLCAAPQMMTYMRPHDQVTALMRLRAT